LLISNFWVFILFFWGQNWWVIPMTSSIKVSKDLSKSFSQKNIPKMNCWPVDRLCIMNTSNVIFFISSKPYIGTQDHNRRYKLILEIELSKGFAPTRLFISIFHRLIGQYFESGILFISLANLHRGKRW